MDEFVQSLEEKRDILIEKLINFGIFKKNEMHLFELSVTELEDEYMRIKEECG